MNKITQDMKYRQPIMRYAEKNGVAKASRKYNKARSYIYFWRKGYDGSLESLKPYQYSAIDEYSRLRYLGHIKSKAHIPRPISRGGLQPIGAVTI